MNENLISRRASHSLRLRQNKKTTLGTAGSSATKTMKNKIMERNVKASRRNILIKSHQSEIEPDPKATVVLKYNRR